LEAIENQNVNIFKDGISVPGLTLKYMFQDLPSYFTVPNEKNKDLYQLFKNNIVGVPSIVFHRYHERDVTTILPRDLSHIIATHHRTSNLDLSTGQYDECVQ